MILIKKWALSKFMRGGGILDYIGYFLVAIIVIFVVVKLLEWPIKMLVKLIINGVIGAIMLFALNIFGKYIGISIGINIVTALIAGIFGIPGVIFLVILKFIM